MNHSCDWQREPRARRRISTHSQRLIACDPALPHVTDTARQLGTADPGEMPPVRRGTSSANPDKNSGRLSTQIGHSTNADSNAPSLTRSATTKYWGASR